MRRCIISELRNTVSIKLTRWIRKWSNLKARADYTQPKLQWNHSFMVNGLFATTCFRCRRRSDNRVFPISSRNEQSCCLNSRGKIEEISRENVQNIGSVQHDLGAVGGDRNDLLLRCNGRRSHTGLHVTHKTQCYLNSRRPSRRKLISKTQISMFMIS